VAGDRGRAVIGSADVVLVGSGAFGASAAYHLARRGARVAVLDRAGLATQTSPRAAGLSSQVRATPALTRLAQRAVTKLAAFTEETGQPLRFTQSGALKIARTERDAEQLSREVARGAVAGVPIDFVSINEARRRLPILDGRGIVAITWSPTDCNVEPSELPLGYCRAAEKLGAVLLPQAPATGFEIGSRGVEGVRTPRGTIATRAVVDAAGAWARLVATGLGASLPIVPTRHQLLITEPIPGVGPDFPIARVIDANVYVRHERGGLMLGGYETDPVQLEAGALSPTFDMAELPLDIEVLWRLARSVREQFPIFQDPSIRIAEHRGGLPTLTVDDRYLVGPLPGVAGAWVMSGCCVGGLSVSPALGEAVAEWILDGTPSLDLSEISTSRFARYCPDETELRERCRQAYATHYRTGGDAAATT
jgi:glycine/D-amino acid oxidase-like deaminating enzyme